MGHPVRLSQTITTLEKKGRSLESTGELLVQFGPSTWLCLLWVGCSHKMPPGSRTPSCFPALVWARAWTALSVPASWELGRHSTWCTDEENPPPPFIQPLPAHSLPDVLISQSHWLPSWDNSRLLLTQNTLLREQIGGQGRDRSSQSQ